MQKKHNIQEIKFLDESGCFIQLSLDKVLSWWLAITIL